MASGKGVAVTLVATLCILHSSAVAFARDGSSNATTAPAAREFLDAHNRARAAVGVGPLRWSQSLAAATSRLVRYQRNKMTCQFADLKPGRYGANQLMAKGSEVTPRMAVEAWAREKEFYDYGSNTCAGKHTCGVYKQVVWRNSTEVGCAQVSCVEEHTSLTLCFYYPPGNIVGERPY